MLKKKKNNRNKMFSIVKIFSKYLIKLLVIFIIIFVYIWTLWWLSLKPSLLLDWNDTEKILANIDFSKEETNNTIFIQNVRNFRHITEQKAIKWYYDQIYDLNKLERLYYIVEPFSKFNGPAHTMLSFEFSDWKYLVISAEIRKEKWENFDPFLWILNQYEIVYILGDENDLIRLRTNIRKDEVRMYPIKVSKDNLKKIFLSALHRADKLSKEPEFYNTFWNTCMTNILKHVNSVISDKNKKVKTLNLDIFLPANSDKIAYKLWWIDTNLPLQEARKFYNITLLAQKYKDNKDITFSEFIREKIK